MLAESRGTVRQSINLEEVNGSFRVETKHKAYEAAVICDVSVSGAGIELAEPLDVGMTIDLTFSAGGWKISVEGQVVWCNMRSSRSDGLVHSPDAYRMGVKFNPRNANNNVIFFMASRSIVNPHI